MKVGTPIVKFTDAMSLSQIGGSVRDLAEGAKTKNYYLQKWKEVRLQFLTRNVWNRKVQFYHQPT
jgi:hypothetical protein